MRTVSPLWISIYEGHLNSFLGFEKVELIRKWGQPLRAYVAGNRKYLIYYSSKYVIKPDEKISCSNSSQNTSKVIYKECFTIFELKGNIVISYRWEEDLCQPKKWGHPASVPSP